MATTRPAAVVMSASEMPGATARRVAAPAVPRPWKASMMPMTVPKRPMKGAIAAMVASQVMRLLHGGEGFAGGGLGGALEGHGVARQAAAAGLALVLVVDLVEDGDERAGLELVGDGGDFAERRPDLRKARRKRWLCVCALLKLRPLGEHDGPGEDAGEQQNAEHGEGDGAAVVHHLHKALLWAASERDWGCRPEKRAERGRGPEA